MIAVGKKLVVGNWKCNGSLSSATALFSALGQSDLGQVEVVICPPLVHLGLFSAQGTGASLTLGAQNLSEYGNGPYTGEVSAEMLHDLGCRYVIVGHSERRALFGDTPAVVSRKLRRAVDQGLTPILCVGETLDERNSSLTRGVIIDQLVSADILDPGVLVVAYEPVWAIGTGLSATVDQVAEVHGWIREWLVSRYGAWGERISILYGGSVKPETAGSLFRCANVDGGLIGGASLSAADFVDICQQASGASETKFG